MAKVIKSSPGPSARRANGKPYRPGPPTKAQREAGERAERYRNNESEQALIAGVCDDIIKRRMAETGECYNHASKYVMAALLAIVEEYVNGT